MATANRTRSKSATPAPQDDAPEAQDTPEDPNGAQQGAVPALAAGERPVGLWRKILWVTQHLPAVPKNGRNTHHNYEYAMEEDVVLAVRRLCVQAGLVLVFSEVECTQVEGLRDKNKQPHITRLGVDFTLVDADDPEQRHTCRVYGYGMDGQDKGPYKALTGAKKYAIMKLFHLATGDDPERDLAPAPQPVAQQQRPPARNDRRNAQPQQQRGNGRPRDYQPAPDPMQQPARAATIARVRELAADPLLPPSEKQRAETFLSQADLTEGNVRSCGRALADMLEALEAQGGAGKGEDDDDLPF